MASNNAINRPTPTPDNDTTVVVVVFVSLGCIMFLAFLAFVICFLIKKKSNKKKNSEKSEKVRVDEHFKMKEAIVEGPHGAESVVLSVEDDIHIEELVKKGEKQVGKHGAVGSSRS